MSRLVLCFSACLLVSLRLFGQVEVTSSLSEKIYLKYEGIPLTMEVKNRSGQEIILGEKDAEDLILIRLRDLNNRVVPRSAKPLLKEPWVIPDGETSVRTFDLVQLFNIQESRSYRVLQDVKLAGESYEGPPLHLEVVEGLEEERIKSRKNDRIYTLIGVHRGGRDELLMRITNYKNTMVLATYYLEKHLKFYAPFMRVGKDGEIATLHYVSPRQVVMVRFNPDGTPIKRTYFSATAGVPVRLLDGGDGDFVVMGAVEIKDQNRNTEGGDGAAEE